MGDSLAGVAVFLAFVLLLGALFVGLFSLGSFQNAPLTGLATHGTYATFSAPEPGFTVGGGLVRASDAVVFKTAWYSVNGSSWQSLSLSGSAYGSISSWLSGVVSAPLPAALSGVGEHYLIVYTCTSSSGSWDCHGATAGSGGWQLLVINNAVSSCGGSVCKVGEYCSAQNACLLTVPGHTYFVAVNGSDNNPGTFSQPWATWKKGFESARPGDIVYFRGGTYMATGIAGTYIGVYNVEGTEQNQLYFFNYPGEAPILDGSLMTNGPNGFNTAIDIGYSHWFNFRGLTVRNFRQYVNAGAERSQLATAFGCYACSNFHYENCVAHDIGGRGWYYMSIGDYGGWNQPDNSSWINCDSYNNVDPLSFYTVNGTRIDNAGNAADGFFIQLLANPPGRALIRGCRSWHNSDDGFNLDGDGYFEVSDCWSFNHSYPSLYSNEGNGFKLDTGYVSSTNLRTITNCIAAGNPGMGFDTNNAGDAWPRQEIYNSLSYNELLGAIVQNCEETPMPDASVHVIRNMISYKDSWGSFENVPWLQGRTDYLFTEDHNTWRTTHEYPYWEENPDYDVTDDDFVSLDVNELAKPRKADGSLPDVTFGHLKADSDLIDGGTLIPGYHCATAGAHPGEGCVEWYGVAPDLGPFEYQQTIACTAHASSSCYGSDVYWYDSCGAREGIRFDCTASQTCSAGACVDNPPVASQIIADHTVVDRYDDIPSCYIDEVKKMLVDIGGESHSGGYRLGVEMLELNDSRFQATTFTTDPPPADTNQYLRLGRPWMYGEGIWTWQGGIDSLNSQMAGQAATGNPYDVFGFGWCWDMTWTNPPGGTEDPVYQVRWAGSSDGGPQGSLRWGLDSGDQALTGNSVNMDDYLDAVEQYNAYAAAHGVLTKFIFTTGPVDGNEGTENGVQREIKHDYIRAFVAANSSRILFDYADILTWNDEGEHYIATWNDAGTLRQHAQIHPDNLLDYDENWGFTGMSGASGQTHIGEVGAMRLGKAMWWMLARMKGWDGVSTTCG